MAIYNFNSKIEHIPFERLFNSSIKLYHKYSSFVKPLFNYAKETTAEWSITSKIIVGSTCGGMGALAAIILIVLYFYSTRFRSFIRKIPSYISKRENQQVDFANVIQPIKLESQSNTNNQELAKSQLINQPTDSLIDFTIKAIDELPSTSRTNHVTKTKSEKTSDTLLNCSFCSFIAKSQAGLKNHQKVHRFL